MVAYAVDRCSNYGLFVLWVVVGADVQCVLSVDRHPCVTVVIYMHACVKEW